MRSLPRDYRRLAWVVVVNGAVIYELLAGGEGTANTAIAAALSAGIILELAGSALSALLNVGSYLFLPLGWTMLWMAPPHIEADIVGESNKVLILMVLPSLVIATVNLFFYVRPLRRWWWERRKKRTPTAEI
jgi:hypothetical protein